jgi:hypothetical protein
MVYTIPAINLTANSTGFESIPIYASGQINTLAGGVLFLVFLAIMLVGYSAQKKKESGNLAMWAATSGLITTTGAIFLFLIKGIVNIETVIVCLSVTIFLALWALLSYTREEQGI